jgi:hypothetical protein
MRQCLYIELFYVFLACAVRVCGSLHSMSWPMSEGETRGTETNWLLTRAVAVAAQTNSKLATVQHLHDITMQVSLPIYPSHPSYRGAVDPRSIIYMPATCQLNPT